MYTPIYPNSKGKYGNNYWETISPKLQREVRLYSDLEYDHWVLVESNPNVKTYCEQPIKISTYYDGRTANTIIDMWVQYRNNYEEFIEVKYSKDLNPNNPKSLRNIRQVNIQQQWCRENGITYKIMTEKEIRKNIVLLDNLKFIISNVKNREVPIETDRLRIIKIVTGKGKVTLSELKLFLKEIDYSRILEAVSWLIYKGILNSDIDSKRMDYTTEVWLNAKE